MRNVHVDRGLQQLLDYDGDDVDEAFCLNFEVSRDVFGQIKHFELIKNGCNITVIKDNK